MVASQKRRARARVNRDVMNVTGEEPVRWTAFLTEQFW